MDEDKLRKTLNAPNVPDDLVTKIQTNWQMQQTETKTDVVGAKSKYISIAASFFAVTFFIYQLNVTPALVSVAWSDVLADAKQDIGISIPLKEILSDQFVQGSLQHVAVEMTKVCRLEDTRTVHMKIAGENRGSIHVFMKKGNFDIPLWQSKAGENKDIGWKIIQSGNNVSVLVLYTATMKKNKVDTLIQHMFYS